ncbi:MAG: MFS transporter [Lentisphaerae bacterium]|nr:MFS transporter [Lentisphaerota bacterium]
MIHSIRYGLAVNYAGMMCMAIAINLLPVFLTTISHEFGGVQGLTNEQLGRLAGITFVGLVGGILVTGPLADRWGAKLFTLAGNGLIVLGLLGLGMSPDYGSVCIAVFVMGLGAGILDMVLSPIVCALQPHRRTSAMNWLHSFYCIGAVITVLLSALTLKLGMGWRTLSFVLALLPALVTVAFAFMEIPNLVTAGAERLRLRELIKIRFFHVALLAIFFGGAAELGLAQWLPAYAETTLGFSKWTSGLSLLFFSLSMTIGRISVGLMGNRVNPYTVLLICCGGSVFLFLGCSFAPWPGVALAACMLVGITGSCLWPSTLGVVADHFPRGGASMFGFLAALGNFGGVFMPWMVGVIADNSNLRWGLGSATLCPLFMIFLLLWMRKQEKEQRVAGSAVL